MVHGYPIIQSEGFILTRGAVKPQIFKSYKAAKAAQKKLPENTITFKVEILAEKIEEIRAKEFKDFTSFILLV